MPPNTMRMKRLPVLLFLLLGCDSALHAQLVTWSPAFPTAEDTVLITFDASKGNKGLFNYAGDVYIHTGLITNLSSGRSDWKYVPSTWNTNDPAFRMTALGNNKFQFRFDTLKKYFNLPASEQILRIAMVFRSYNPSGDALEGKVSDLSADGGNVYIPVYPDRNLRIVLTKPETEPRYDPFLIPLNKQVNEEIEVEAIASEDADIRLLLNNNEINSATGVGQLAGSALITDAGEQTITAEATKSGTTVKYALSFFASGAVETAPLPAGTRDGINYHAGGTSVTLVLFAPYKNTVLVIGDFNDWTESVEHTMKKTPDGNRWWVTLSNLTPGTEYAYQYLVDGTLRIADPYAEKILDPDNDTEIRNSGVYPGLKAYPSGKTNGIVGVLQTNKPVYNWVVQNFTRPRPENLLIYELLVRDFLSDHSWNSLKDTIPYLKKLGINTIELMPFNEFEGNRSWGYNPSFYFAPDKFYGTDDALKSFIDACHQNGIAVVMDMVLNHSFGQSPMVQLYFDAAQNRPSANSPWFNPIAKHPFNVGYDMNHESDAVKYFFSRVTEFWLKEYRLDGFRFDLSKGFTQKNSCSTGGCGTDAEVAAWSAYDASRVAIWKAYYDTLQKHAPGSFVILEHLSENSEEKELSDYGMMFWGKATDPFNEATMGYHDGGKSDFSYALYTSRGWSRSNLVTYMESHDEERLMYKNLQYGNSSGTYNVKQLSVGLTRNAAAAAFFWLIPGPKMMWQFGEVGYDYSINYCTDGSINDACRVGDKPVRWDYLQNPDRLGLRNVYDSLLKLRRQPLFTDTWKSSDIAVSANSTNGLKSMVVRTFNDTSSIVVVGNFGMTTQSIQVTFPRPGNWFRYMSTEVVTATGSAQAIQLNPGEFRIFLSRNLYGTNVTAVRDIDADGRSIRFQLVPNPATPQSDIQWEVAEAGNLGVTVCNSMGQRIGTPRTLMAGAGKGSVRWESVAGNGLPPGFYYIRFHWKGRTYVEKVAVFR